jgi:hypothetical protein
MCRNVDIWLDLGPDLSAELEGKLEKSQGEWKAKPTSNTPNNSDATFIVGYPQGARRIHSPQSAIVPQALHRASFLVQFLSGPVSSSKEKDTERSEVLEHFPMLQAPHSVVLGDVRV